MKDDENGGTKHYNLGVKGNKTTIMEYSLKGFES